MSRDRIERRKRERELRNRGATSEEIPEQLRPILRALPEDKKMELVAYFEHHSGPLPPPWQLAEYQNIMPDAADFFKEAFLRQQNHRITMESKLLPAQNRQFTRGQWMAFILVLVFLGIGVWLLQTNRDAAGLTIIGSLGIGCATAFLRRGGEKTDK